jgi:lysophospholipase L1-like esterase
MQLRRPCQMNNAPINMKHVWITFLVVCCQLAFGQSREKTHLTFWGSSVCNGTGAENKHGYAWKAYHGNIIDTTRYAYANASTGGDNTLKVEQFDRLTQKLYPTQPDIVVIGLSLSNEGIRRAMDENEREQILEQFRSRLLALADSLDRQGIQPVIANCYAHSFFSPEHYRFTRRMNEILNTWKYPSINILGTIDDWRGRWGEGYAHDPGHPNDKGHQEMAYAIVPSLFDAIQAGKPIPGYDWNRSYTQLINEQRSEHPISIEVGSVMHSFTISFRAKEMKDGSIAGFTAQEGEHTLVIEGNTLRYKSLSVPVKEPISEWTHIVLAHSYANQQTMLIVNGSLVGTVKEQLAPTHIYFGGTVASMDMKDLALHRACLNTEEAQGLYNKKFIQSSLEFYSPLTSTIRGEELNNRAQSFTKAKIGAGIHLQLHAVGW